MLTGSTTEPEAIESCRQHARRNADLPSDTSTSNHRYPVLHVEVSQRHTGMHHRRNRRLRPNVISIRQLYDIDDLPDEAPALDGSTTTSVPRDYLFTLRSDDFTVVGTTPTAAAIVDYKIDVTAADVRDGVITAQLQRSASEGTWEPFPYTINGFVPHTEPKRAASLTLTYQVSAGYVRLIATAHLTGAEMSRALILFNDFKIRIRIVHYPWTILCRHPWFPCSRHGGTSPLGDHAGAAPDP